MSDVLIVDEASMVDLPMMASLIDALPENAILILLGIKISWLRWKRGGAGDICRFAESGYTPQRRQALEAMTGCVLPDKSPAHPVNVQDHLCLLRKVSVLMPVPASGNWPPQLTTAISGKPWRFSAGSGRMSVMCRWRMKKAMLRY